MAIQRTKHEILVGLSIPLTGRFSRQGQQAFEGIRLWQSYSKAAGGISPVRLLYYDDESRAIRAKENALRLLRGDRVDILFGPYSSGLTLAVAPIRQQLLVRKAALTEDRMLFTVTALKKLFQDENFVTLLRAESPDTLPKNLAERVHLSEKA